MIINTTVTVNGYRATIKPKLQFYRGDSVYLVITILDTIINSIEGVDVQEVLPMSALKEVKLILKTPSGSIPINSVEQVDNRVKFKILSDYTQEVGNYQFQLVCFDNDNCMFHIPPCPYSVAEPIGDLV